jgi:transposase
MGWLSRAIAAEIGCHQNTVRRWLHRFNTAGIDRLGDRPAPGRKWRIPWAQRSAIIAMARSVPQGAAGPQHGRGSVR